MSPVSLLLNIFWIVFGGLWMALAWAVAAVLMALTIVGLPWTRAAFNIASYTLLPFGQKAVSRAEYSGSKDVGTVADSAAFSASLALTTHGDWQSVVIKSKEANTSVKGATITLQRS